MVVPGWRVVGIDRVRWRGGDARPLVGRPGGIRAGAVAARQRIMRDTGGKMAELKFEAPLAKFEEADDWGTLDLATLKAGGGGSGGVPDARRPADEDAINLNLEDPDNESSVDNALDNQHQERCVNVNNRNRQPVDAASASSETDNFQETFSGSLEDLVNTFDDKITRCFCNYDESVEKLAPVQVRSQEEIMNECQMWWTITGNFGNILPIDWSKSYARKLHMPALNLNENKEKVMMDDADGELSSEDEAVASDLDMHSLILSGLCQDTEPVKTADEIIREIDDIMEETSPECTPDSEGGDDSLQRKAKQVLHSPLYHDKLKTLTASQLNELYLELELLIRDYSETLISELALRDELEYEKELKNSFISLLLAVQNRRRQHHVDKKKGRIPGNKPAGSESKYLTTVIPYHMDSGPLDNQALQVLIKILKAINEDSPTVPTLLTDYILKVLCPT